MSIPIYVFVFALYYSVSVLTGLWFRSPILSITFAILFWAVCFVLGVAYGRLENRQYNFGATQVSVAGDNVVYADVLQNLFRWDRDDWAPVLERPKTPNDQALAIAAYLERLDEEIADYPGPVLDQDMIMAGSAALQPAIRPSRFQWVASSSKDNWSTKTYGNLPTSTLAVFHSPRLGLVAVTDASRVFQCDLASLRKADEFVPPTNPDRKAGSSKSFAIKFDLISDHATINLPGSESVSLNPSNDEIALYSGGDLVILSRQEDGKYRERIRKELGQQGNRRMTAMVEYRGDHVFVVMGNGRFYHVNTRLMDQEHTLIPLRRGTIRSMTASADGKFAAIVYRNGRIWIYDADRRIEHRNSAVGVQGDVLSATFDDAGRLWIADRFQNALGYDVSNLRLEQQKQPPADLLANIFRFVARPLYRIFPRPGEFYRLIGHLSSSGDSADNPEVDLTQTPADDDPWSPLRNGLIFLAGVLAIACFQFQRQDF